MRKPPPPPGPRGRLLLAGLRTLQKDPLAFLLECTQTYGDFVHLPLRVLDVYLINEPEGIKRVLQDNHRNYSKDTFQYNLLAGITGRGLLTSDGDLWLRQRRLAQPAFHRSRIAALDGLITSAALTMLEGWEHSARQGEPVDVDAEMMRLALEVVGKALFSVDLSAEAGELTGAVLTSLDHLIHRSRNPFSPPDFIPTSRNRRFRAALHSLDQAVYKIIAARRKTLQPPLSKLGEGAGGERNEGDLLDMLLAARDPETGAGMDDRQLHDEIITLLIAGHETVASALTWTWRLLSDHPHVNERLCEELVNNLAGRIPTSTDLPSLPLTRYIFDEALRLYPPAWIITRKALGPDEVSGFPIPAGALVILSPYTIQRHPDFWPAPETFDPDRFAPERLAGRPRYAYIPFGGGPRLCIGEGFALTEGQLILATVAARFRLERLPGASVQVEALVTLRPRGGLRMTIHPIV